MTTYGTDGKGSTWLLSEKPIIIIMCVILFGLNLENWFSYMMNEGSWAKWKLDKIISPGASRSLYYMSSTKGLTA